MNEKLTLAAERKILLAKIRPVENPLLPNGKKPLTSGFETLGDVVRAHSSRTKRAVPIDGRIRS